MYTGGDAHFAYPTLSIFCTPQRNKCFAHTSHSACLTRTGCHDNSSQLNTTHLEVEGRDFVETADDMHHCMVSALRADPRGRDCSVEGTVADLGNIKSGTESVFQKSSKC